MAKTGQHTPTASSDNASALMAMAATPATVAAVSASQGPIPGSAGPKVSPETYGASEGMDCS